MTAVPPSKLVSHNHVDVSSFSSSQVSSYNSTTTNLVSIAFVQRLFLLCVAVLCHLQGAVEQARIGTGLAKMVNVLGSHWSFYLSRICIWSAHKFSLSRLSYTDRRA